MPETENQKKLLPVIWYRYAMLCAEQGLQITSNILQYYGDLLQSLSTVHTSVFVSSSIKATCMAT